jgi:hypothetical protein
MKESSSIGRNTVDRGPTRPLIPGHCLPLCATCTHRTADLSHPQPCGRVRWEGAKHHKPDLKRWECDGAVTCGDYSPKAEGEAAAACPGSIAGPFWGPTRAVSLRERS